MNEIEFPQYMLDFDYSDKDIRAIYEHLLKYPNMIIEPGISFIPSTPDNHRGEGIEAFFETGELSISRVLGTDKFSVDFYSFLDGSIEDGESIVKELSKKYCIDFRLNILEGAVELNADVVVNKKEDRPILRFDKEIYFNEVMAFIDTVSSQEFEKYRH